MTTALLQVEGMSCEHCVKAVSEAVGCLDGVEAVSVDLDAGTVEVTYDGDAVTLEDIQSTIDDQGYEVAG